MTIKEAAAFYGVSTQAIYQRIAKAGKKSKELTNGKTGELTGEGEALLSTWFTNDKPPEVDKECKHCKALNEEIAQLKAEKIALQAQLATITEDKEKLFKLLNQAQQSVQALSVASVGGRLYGGTPPLWERVKIFFIGDKQKK